MRSSRTVQLRLACRRVFTRFHRSLARDGSRACAKRERKERTLQGQRKGRSFVPRFVIPRLCANLADNAVPFDIMRELL